MNKKICIKKLKLHFGNVYFKVSHQKAVYELVMFRISHKGDLERGVRKKRENKYHKTLLVN